MAIPTLACPACESLRRRPLPVQSIWNESTWQFVRCSECGHRYTDPMPTDDDLIRMYDRTYFEAGGAWVCDFWDGSYLANEGHLREEARNAVQHLPFRSGRLLEVGCAGGFFLDEARAAGFDVVGCELNAEMADYGRTALGLTIHEGLFERQGFAPNSFDVIVAQDVLEHTRDPRAFVRAATHLLRPGGVFFVRGPLEDTMRERIYYMLRTVGRRGMLQLREPPFHLQGFSRESFRRIVSYTDLSLSKFTAASAPPVWEFATLKSALATIIDQTAYRVDRWRERGDFMTAIATKAPRSV